MLVPALVAVPELDDRVEVAILALRGGDDRGELALALEQVLVRVAAAIPRGGFEPLVDVGVGEHRADRLALADTGREPQVVQVAGRLQLVLTGRDRALAVAGLARRPGSRR